MNPPPLALLLVVFWLSVGCGGAPVRGDGGTVRLRERKGPYEISVFTAPTPLRAGAVDISVLVQDAGSGDPVPEARVTVSLAARPGRHGQKQQATTEAATNKLLRAALFEIPRAGWWDVEVTIAGGRSEGRGEEKVHFAVEAAEPLPRWVAFWPWLIWPVLVIVLFGLRRPAVRLPVDS
jgi:hypothetical protein